ncbi:hypothetical protein DFJ74DRAFT_407892 [Hyaloraphidium curvatum]|nr:hypothetical protein DFJ74DRAFT_407892 [Hyaloraphidium curvatum]
MNVFRGNVTGITAGKLLSEIEISTPTRLKLVAVVTNEELEALNCTPGQQLNASVPPAAVVLVRAESTGPPPSHSRSASSFSVADVTTSARNKVLCRITDVSYDSELGPSSTVGAVACRVACEVQPHGGAGAIVGGGEKIEALVTTESAKTMKLAQNEFVWALWKAFSVSLTKG